ncbi:MAG: hypothetical protein RL129_771 [Actinomycetota bacterium]|jgi:hypothetical protein
MPNIITASQLRTVLGVSSSLYSDAYLNGIIESAEGVVLPLLESYSNRIQGYEIKNGTAILTTQLPNLFVENQTLTISGVSTALNGSHVVTNTYLRPYFFSIATNEADLTYQPLIPQGTAYVSGKSAGELYAADPDIENAITIVSVEIFQSITAAGGQIEGVDFTPAPYRMGRSLSARVYSLIAKYVEVGSMAQ